jgi:hypothetical protein
MTNDRTQADDRTGYTDSIGANRLVTSLRLEVQHSRERELVLCAGGSQGG